MNSLNYLEIFKLWNNNSLNVFLSTTIMEGLSAILTNFDYIVFSDFVTNWFRIDLVNI